MPRDAQARYVTLFACTVNTTAAAAHALTRNITENFVTALQTNMRAPSKLDCTHTGEQRVLELAKLLAGDLKSTSRHYGGVGYMGIFGSLYGGKKVHFIFRHIAAERPL